MKNKKLKSLLLLIFLCPLILQAGLGTSAKDNEVAYSKKDAFMGDWKGTLNGKTAYGMLTPFLNQEYVLRIYDKDLLTREEYIAPILHLIGTRTNNTIKFHSHYIEVKIVEDAEGKKKPQPFFEKFISNDSLTMTLDGLIGNVTSFKEKEKCSLNLKKIPNLRASSTIGMKPPKGAVVLFDGQNLDKWNYIFHSVRNKKPLSPREKSQKDNFWKVVDGTMEISYGSYDYYSKQDFGDCTLHIEFMIPYLPQHRLDAYYRCNGGVYVCGRFEVQIIDSYAAYGFAPGTCGGIYGKKIIDYFASRPPLEWQTYDIDFIAPKFDENGKKIKHGRMTVKFNDILVHKDIELDHRKPDKISGGMFLNDEPVGPILLQDHGSVIRFRNIWVVENND